MINSIFQRTSFVNNYGTTVQLTSGVSGNTYYVHSSIGDDATGDGSREKPFKTLNKAALYQDKLYYLIGGVFTEYVNVVRNPIIGDFGAMLLKNLAGYNYYGDLYHIYADSVTANGIYHCIVDSYDGGGWNNNGYAYQSVIGNWGGIMYQGAKNCTFTSTLPTGQQYNSPVDCIFQKRINWNQHGYYTFDQSPIYYNSCVIPSDAVFTVDVDTVLVPMDESGQTVDWSDDSVLNVQLIRNALKNANIPNYNTVYFQKDGFGNETCKIIHEQRNGGTLPNIFSKYSSGGTVTNYCLNPDLNSEPLYASTIGNYVGGFAPNYSDNLGEVENVDVTGISIGAGDLLVKNDGDVITSNTDSLQIWNRITQVTPIQILNGQSFDNIIRQVKSGAFFGYYLGKLQNLVGTTIYNPGDILEVGKTYKVFNDNSKLPINGVVYNGNVTYPSNAFTVYDSGNTFSLFNEGTGSYLKELYTIPNESVEIQLYDNPTTISTFPKFSAPINSELQILFHRENLRAVTFSEIATDKDLSIYGDYAVTNADAEFANYYLDYDNYVTRRPAFIYFKIEINLHYNKDYGF